jgi:N-acetyl-anhydromuramyl-L-alanine amidase AmpD
VALNLDDIKFVQAKNYTMANRLRVDLVVLHSMESQEKPNTAENVAAWFAGPNAPQASAHFCVDSDSAVRCVLDRDVAWHAPGANKASIGIEHAGKAGQTAADWADEYSRATLERSAQICAALCRKHRIPAQRVWPGGLRAGLRGITTHAAVSLAFGKSSHWDPGTGFPMTAYVARVVALLAERNDA